MADEQNPPTKKEALPERLVRKVLENMGDVVDRKFGRTVEPRSGVTTGQLVQSMKRLIDERSRFDAASSGRVVPHLMKLKLEWGVISAAPPEILKDLEHEILAAAIDHINDHRYRTLAPVRVEAAVDIFTTGISVDPSFGEFEEGFRRQEEAKRAQQAGVESPAPPPEPDVSFIARVTLREG